MQIHGPDGNCYPIDTRRDLVRFIYALLEDLEDHPETWDNSDLGDYLEALAGFLGDAEGYYRNRNEDFDADVPSWRVLADSLLAATCYD